MDLKETDILGDSISQHWYYRSKAKAMNRLLGQSATIHNLGCGRWFGIFLASSSSQLFSPRCVVRRYQLRQ